MLTLVTLQGRLDRRRFALTALSCDVAFYALNVLGTIAWGSLRLDGDSGVPFDVSRGYLLPHEVALPALLIVMVVLFGLALVMFSASARRLHDVSLSAWVVVLAIVVFGFLPKIELPFSFFSIWEWLWIVGLTLWPGNSGDNVFGARPRPETAVQA